MTREELVAELKAHHEPIIVLDKEDEHHVLEPTIQCTCGWAAYQESFFDHLARPDRHLVEGQIG